MNLEPFIRAVSNNDVLWNKKNLHYKDKDRKLQLWKDIGKKFNITGEDAEIYFGKIRAKYTRIKRFLSESAKSGSGSSTVKPWEYMDQLKFLDDVVVPRKVVGSTPSFWKTNLDAEESSEVEITVVVDDIESTIEDDIEMEEYEYEEPPVFSPNACSTSVGISPDPVLKPAAKRKQSHPTLEQQLSSLTHALSLPLPANEDPSETDIFCSFVAKKLQKISQEKLFSVQLKLLNVLHDEVTNL